MSFRRLHSRLMKKQQGFTLVEVVVAAGIFGVAVTGVVGVTRKSHELDVTSVHWQRARIVADSCLETYVYTSPHYDSLCATSAVVCIDDRETIEANDDLIGSLIITVVEHDVECVGGGTLQYKQVRVTLRWTEPEGEEMLAVAKGVPKL